MVRQQVREKMDIPNAPNPANPNAQDQFVNAVQGPTNQVQGHAAQNQVQGPAVQTQPPVQGPVNNNAQVGQNIPAQPQQQLAPAQPVSIGPVAPAPQIIYQNWIGKKPEFSGKPEEDAESYLLSTRDWMEAHNFPEGDKVRHFCLTLIGEARLWYESLALLDDDWPALQNKFRWQYSKIDNTPEQLFHAWRTIKFDENTDTKRLLCPKNESGSSNVKLWGNADIGKFQKHPSIVNLCNFDQCRQSQRHY